MTMRRLRAVWDSITEPRHMSVTYAVVYLVTLATGVVTMLAPPMTIAGEIGPVLTALWSAMFVVAGLLGAVTVLPGWWKWERWACVFALGGIGVYGLVIVTLHFTNEGSRLTQLGILALASIVFVIRLLMIRGRSYAPRG